MQKLEPSGLRAAIVAYMLWGLFTIYWKQLTGLDPFEMIAWRIVSAAAIMAAVVSVRRQWSFIADGFRSSATRWRILVAAFLLTVNWSTYVWAVVNDRVIETALGYFLAPLATMAFGVVLLGERLNALKWLAVLLAVGAVVVVSVSYGEVPIVAVLLALTWSVYGLLKRGVRMPPIPSLASELFALAGFAIGFIVYASQRRTGVVHTASPREWALLLGTGAITATPLLLFAYAATRVPFTILGPVNFLVPIINFLLGWLLYNEALPTSRVIGFVLVWAALVVVTVDTFRAQRAPSSTEKT